MRSLATFVLPALFFFLSSPSFATSPPVGKLDHQHRIWTGVLKKYQVKKNAFVKYKELQADVKAQKDKHPLSIYLKDLSAVKRKTYDGWSKNQQMAYLINAYNAFTFKLIIDSYPVSSIKKTVGFLRSPWKKEFFSILDGAIETLDPIEHEWLRPKFKDARVHAAVNCASISCPVLRHEAFVAKKLDKQLDDSFRKFVNDPFRNKYDAKEGVLHLSKIFDWFEEDFEQSYGSVKKTIEKYGSKTALQALKKKGKIKHLDYDWGLNEAKAPKTAS